MHGRFPIFGEGARAVPQVYAYETKSCRESAGALSLASSMVLEI